jgi:hypothetical protein
MDQNKRDLDGLGVFLEPSFPLKGYALIMWLKHFEAVEQERWHSHLTNRALKTLEPESWLLEQVVRFNIGSPRYSAFSWSYDLDLDDSSIKSNPDDSGLESDPDDSGLESNPLYLVVELGYSQLTSLLIQTWVVDVNKLGGEWGTALNVAARHGREDIVRVLLCGGANAYAHIV